MKKTLSLALSLLLLTLSCFVPTGFAEGENTEELLGATFNRITLTDTAFAAGTAKDITFTVPETGNYALFLNKEDVAENAFSAVFTQAAAVSGTEADHTATIGSLDANAKAHIYNYVRVGAAPNLKSGSAYLYKGECTLSLTALNATSIKYLDLRGTDISVGDGKTGILPADYLEYSLVTAPNHVNGEIQKGTALSEGYTYHNLPTGLNRTRQFHLETGRTATYNLNITKAQKYRIGIRSAGFVWTNNPSGEANLSFTASLGGQVIYTSPVETIPLTAQSNNGADTWSDLGVYTLDEGIIPLSITTTRGRYIYDLRVEATTDPIVANAKTLPATIISSNIGASEGVSLTNDYFVLENGDSVSFAFEVTGEAPVDIYLSGMYGAGETVSYTCKLDENEPVSGTLTGFHKLLENQTLSAGVHTLTLTNTGNTQLCPATFTVADAQKEDTVISAYETVPVEKDVLITPVPLESTKMTYGKIDFADNRYHILGGGELTFSVNIPQAGYYTFYANAKADQGTTKVYLDGETDISNTMYDSLHNDNIRVASTNYLDRKLTNGLIYLEPGEHTVTIAATATVEVNSLFVRFSDGFISTDVLEETIIPAWDFNASANVNAAWYFPAQYYQKQSEGVTGYNRGAYHNMKNVIIHQQGSYTYTVKAEENGYYDFSAFFTSSNNTVEFQFAVDGMTNCYAVGTPNKAVGEAVSAEPMYLTKGYHDITVSRTTRTYTAGTARVYGFRFAKSAINAAYAAKESTSVEAAFAVPVTGTVYAALYKENQLIGVGVKAVNAAANIVMNVPHTTIPDKVKIFAWESPANLKPVASAIEITDITERKTTLHLMGDSVCVAYNEAAFPQQGWGVYIGTHLNDKINIANKAKGGASTKTYLRDGLWKFTERYIVEGDYVMINFGLNDFYNISEDGKGTTIEQYKENLTMYCNVILEKGATPILISTIPECKENYNSLIARANAMEEVANSLNVTFLNLNETLNAEWLFDENGSFSADKTLATFNYYYLSKTAFTRIEKETGKTITEAKWNSIAEEIDRTHTNEDGAKHVAETIARLLSETDNSLTEYLVD